MKIINALYIIVVISLISITSYAKNIKKYDKLNLNTKELDEFTLYSSSEGTISDEFEVDLNDDNNPEKLIGVTCGNGGCAYYCFQNIGNQKYKFINIIFVHRKGFEVLKTKHNGFSDILSYWHLSAGEGLLSRHEFDGEEYKTKVSIEVQSKSFDLLEPTIKE